GRRGSGCRGPGGRGSRVKAFLEYVAKSLVDDPDAVVVDMSEADDEVTLTLKVGEGDMGRIIGRDGRIANAIRSLLRVMGARDGRHVELEIVGDAEAPRRRSRARRQGPGGLASHRGAHGPSRAPGGRGIC